jgi:hypothetical protein
MGQPPDMPETVGAVCPHCKQVPDRTPKRKKKCPYCGKYIYVRRLPDGDHPKVLVSQEGAKQIDKEWETIQSRKKRLRRLTELGMSDADFQRHKKTLGGRFGQKPSDGDVIWSLFQQAANRAMKSGELQQLKMLYFEMALFLYHEGRDFFRTLQESAKMELMRYKHMDFVKDVQIHTSGGCDACQKLEGQMFGIEEALRTMPVRCRECTFDFAGTGQPGWCRCWYAPVIE